MGAKVGVEQNIPLDLKQIQITDSFWKHEIELVRTSVIPYQWKALNDEIDGAAKSYCMRNYKLAGKVNKQRSEGNETKEYPTNQWETVPSSEEEMENRFYGWYFQDSDFSKWIEAVGYSLIQHPDKELEGIADEAIDIVALAQQENGYLDTHYIINNMNDIFTNLQDAHELYCFGHLVEGAIAYYQATGKEKLLQVAIKYADFIDETFGFDAGKKQGYPGHEIAEMALVRLYEVTKEKKYLDLAKFFLDIRGMDGKGNAYSQSHMPVREQKEAVGHAVRAVYLYSGMADVARLTGDVALFETCEVLWDSIVNEKLYITGGIGGTHLGEAFSFPYDLPNDTAYAETCASIGLMFFARRMLQMTPNSKYADVLEQALYNGVLSGMSLDGTEFFYVNPLEVVPEACYKDERKFHVKPVRQKWFGCACCPPNIARTLSSIGSYAYTETEDTLFVHLYMGAKIKKMVANQQLEVQITSQMPWEGKASIQVTTKEPTKATIALRIPNWTNNYEVVVDGECEQREENGYLYITKVWAEDLVTVLMPMEVKEMVANPLVRETAGQVAIVRGPIVYCIEEKDNGSQLHRLKLQEDNRYQVIDVDEFGMACKVIEGNGLRLVTNEEHKLYQQRTKEEKKEVLIRWIPYYMWNNRGEGEMRVWLSI